MAVAAMMEQYRDRVHLYRIETELFLILTLKVNRIFAYCRLVLTLLASY